MGTVERQENLKKRVRRPISKEFSSEKINETDGFKIDFEEGWVHMRKSNTEPIIRIYAEANNQVVAKSLIDQVKDCF